MASMPSGAIIDDPRRLRQALGLFATGVTVVTTRTADGKTEGLTANSFSSVSLDPPLVLWSLQKTAPSLESFRQSGFFVVNVLGAHQHDYCRHFCTPAADKFQGIPHEIGIAGCPVLSDCIASFECSTFSIVDAGDHVILIGRVLRVAHGEGEPLIFSGGSLWVPHKQDGQELDGNPARSEDRAAESRHMRKADAGPRMGG